VPLWSAIASPVIGIGTAVLDLTIVVHVLKGANNITAGTALAVGFIGLFGILKQKCQSKFVYPSLINALDRC
jgi:hypothetical protein